MKTNSKAFEEKINTYIIRCIDNDAYEVKADTDKEKLQFLADTFKNEYGDWMKKNYNASLQRIFCSWLQGMPSACSVEYDNFEILKVAKEWGSLPENSTDAQDQAVLSNWFSLVATKTIKMMAKHDIFISLTSK